MELNDAKGRSLDLANKWLETVVSVLEVGKIRQDQDHTRCAEAIVICTSRGLHVSEVEAALWPVLMDRTPVAQYVHVPHVPCGPFSRRRNGKADIHVDSVHRVQAKEDPMRRWTAMPAMLASRPARDVQVRKERPKDDGLAKVSLDHVMLTCCEVCMH